MTIRRGEFAVYHGKEYSYASMGDQAVIFSDNEADLTKGFQKHRSGRIIKIVSLQELASAYTVMTKGLYQNTICSIMDVQGDLAVLRLYDNYLVAEKLGFTAIEPTIFEKRVDKRSVQEAWEERLPFKGFDLQENERQMKISL